MPDRRDNGNVIEQGWDVFAKVQLDMGSPMPDEVSFVGGFLCCFGILTGRVDIGLDQNAPLDKIMDNIHEDIAAVGHRIATKQAEHERNIETLKRAGLKVS